MVHPVIVVFGAHPDLQYPAILTFNSDLDEVYGGLLARNKVLCHFADVPHGL
jgi:hypothetical protein